MCRSGRTLFYTEISEGLPTGLPLRGKRTEMREESCEQWGGEQAGRREQQVPRPWGRACLEAEGQAGARCVSDIRDCYERAAKRILADQSNDFEIKRY